MKLKTQNGELELPSDFTFAVQRTNPYLSEEGDATIPAKLPASRNNKKVLQNIHRIDKADKYLQKVNATLEAGPVMKNGQLIIDTAHASEGFDCSFAVENSDLYSQHKEKTLKEILQGEKETFGTVEGMMDVLDDLFNGLGSPNSPYTIFPVAIAKYTDNNTTVYQYNNQYDTTNQCFIWEARTVREGDINMAVPDGYGISPFFYLHAAIDNIFRKLGYTIAENCFTTGLASKIVLLNNCSDTICKHEINYSDLVPSCTLSEFVTWLLAKFHVGVRVDSTGKKVYIRKMESMLTAAPSTDITNKLVDDFTVQMSPSSRIVITPMNKLEGTEPAANTCDELKEKYAGWTGVTEQEFITLEGNSPAYYDCLIFRKATGQFYELIRNLATGKQKTNLLGTNHFTYDRDNADEAEQFSPEDIMPLMITNSKMDTMPFIGERVHAHTTYGSNKNDVEQDIMICQEVVRNNNEPIAFQRTGTTQNFVPYTQASAGNYGRTIGQELTTYGLYADYWQHYNDILLNNEVKLRGKVIYSIDEILNMDMATMRICKGQKLLPVSAEATIGSRTVAGNSEFILVKEFAGATHDQPITPTPVSRFRWHHYTDADSVASEWYDDNKDSIIAQIEYLERAAVSLDFVNYTITYVDTLGDIYLGTPSSAGETSVVIVRNANMQMNMRYTIEEGHEAGVTRNHTETYMNATIQVWFVSEAY